MSMQNHELSFNQAVFSIVLFSFGSSVVIGISTSVKQDTLLAIGLATLAAVPMFWIYGRTMKLFPQSTLFEIAELVFGKVGGKAVTVLMVWYAVHLAALVLRNFSEFTQVSTMPETPQLPVIILLGLTAIYLARSNIHAIGKWSVVSFFLVLFAVLLTFSAALPQIRLNDILPLMEYPAAQIAKTSAQIFSFPYAETVLFLYIGSVLPKEKPFRIFFHGLLLTLIVFLLVFIRNLVTLGPKLMDISFFPSFITVRIIAIGDFIARFEGVISSNFLLAGILKISICLLAAAKGLSSLFQLNNHRTMVLPCGMLAMALCTILYKNTMEMFAFMDYYAYYAFPFQVLIPLAILIAGEIYIRKQKIKAPPLPAADSP